MFALQIVLACLFWIAMLVVFAAVLYLIWDDIQAWREVRSIKMYQLSLYEEKWRRVGQRNFGM